jgi:hypothetical protein
MPESSDVAVMRQNYETKTSPAVSHHYDTNYTTKTSPANHHNATKPSHVHRHYETNYEKASSVPHYSNSPTSYITPVSIVDDEDIDIVDDGNADIVDDEELNIGVEVNDDETLDMDDHNRSAWNLTKDHHTSVPSPSGGGHDLSTRSTEEGSKFSSSQSPNDRASIEGYRFSSSPLSQSPEDRVSIADSEDQTHSDIDVEFVTSPAVAHGSTDNGNVHGLSAHSLDIESQDRSNVNSGIRSFGSIRNVNASTADATVFKICSIPNPSQLNVMPELLPLDDIITVDDAQGPFCEVSSPVPGLSVPGLSVPGLSVPGLSVPGLSVPGLSVPGLSPPHHSVPGLPGLSSPGHEKLNNAERILLNTSSTSAEASPESRLHKPTSPADSAYSSGSPNSATSQHSSTSPSNASWNASPNYAALRHHSIPSSTPIGICVMQNLNKSTESLINGLELYRRTIVVKCNTNNHTLTYPYLHHPSTSNGLEVELDRGETKPINDNSTCTHPHDLNISSNDNTTFTNNHHSNAIPAKPHHLETLRNLLPKSRSPNHPSSPSKHHSNSSNDLSSPSKHLTNSPRNLSSPSKHLHSSKHHPNSPKHLHSTKHHPNPHKTLHDRYMECRRKNNEAAKKSRAKRKLQYEENMRKLRLTEGKCGELQRLNARLMQENALLKHVLADYKIDWPAVVLRMQGIMAPFH